MEEPALRRPELVGREDELDRLRRSLNRAIAGRGSMVLIAGEAGIGKTRLVSELKAEDVNFIQGWCLAEHLEPLMPVKSALREAELMHLMSGDAPPLVVSAYLMHEGGKLIAKAEREETDLDPDLFAGMLQAVGDFVQDSLSMMRREGQGGLKSLAYGEYSIVIQNLGSLSLAVVVKGEKSEFLIDDMKRFLAGTGGELRDWDGDMAAAQGVLPGVRWFIDSGKYEGRFLVDDPKIRQENLFDNVLLGLQRASEGRPLVLFLDDLQWADQSTLNLLHYLSRNTRENRILILGTYRPEDVMGSEGRPHPLETTMQNMSREDLFERMDLARLDREETREVIRSALGKDSFGDDFFLKTHRETEGTPFFVLEVMRLHIDSGAISKDADGVWNLVADVGALNIPTKVYDVIRRRLDRLAPGQREVLECASVIGEEFGSDILGKVAGADKTRLLRDLSEIERTHGLLHYARDRYRFDHAKVREVLYGGLGEELRKDYHRMAGDAFAGSDPDVNVLAYHYYEAGDARAGGYLIKAGDTAKARYANEEAIRFYESSLDMTGEESTEVLEKLGDTLVITGDLDRAVEVFLKVKDTAEDNETMARMLRRVCDAYENKGEYDRALETLTEAKALVGEGTAEFARICRSESAVRFKKGDYDEALALSRAALGIFEEAGLRKDAGNALRDVGKIHLVKGEYDDALDYTEKSLEVMSEIDDHYGTAAALNNMAIVFRNQGEVERALEFYEGGRIIFDIIGDKRALSTLVNNIGSAYHSAGDLDKALEYHELSRRLKRTIGDVMGETAALNNIGNVHSRRGETDKALECHDRSLELTEKLGDKLGIALSCHNIGNIHRLNGEYDTALEYYERSLDIKQQIGYKTMSTLCELAETHLELDDPVTALEYAEKAMDASADIDAKGELGRSRRVLAMVRMKQGKLQEAKEQFEDARTLLEEFGEKIELAALYYEYALFQKQSDRQEEARDLLNRALEMFEGMGMVKWVEKVKTELVRL